MILKCKNFKLGECENKFQDEEYGKRKRVHNKTRKGGTSSSIYRCTVCGTEREVSKKKSRD